MVSRRQVLGGAFLAIPGCLLARGAMGGAAFEGETIRWIVPYDTGGGYDEYSRLIAPVLEAHTGARVDILNMPGGGGIRGAVEIFRSPADGLHIGIVNAAGLMAQGLAEPDREEMDISRYSIVGRVAAEPRVLVVNAKSDFATVEDLKTAGRPIVCGVTGLGGATYVDAIVAAKILGLDQKVVHGYESSSDLRLALLRGDIDMVWSAYGSAYDSMVAGDFRAVLSKSAAEEELIAGLTTVEEAAGAALDDPQLRGLFDAWLALSEIGRPVVGPPGIPAERLDALRRAFDATLSDPVLLEAVAKANRELSPLPGVEIAALADRFAKIDPDTRALLAEIVRSES